MSEEQIVENTDLNQKDLETLAEALLEHIAHFDDQVELVIASVSEKIDARIRRIVREEMEIMVKGDQVTEEFTPPPEVEPEVEPTEVNTEVVVEPEVAEVPTEFPESEEPVNG